MCGQYPFIGVRGLCCDVTSTSGLYIDDYPGINLKRFSAAAPDEVKNGEDFFKLIHNRATDIVKNDFINSLREKLSFGEVGRNYSQGKIGSFFENYSEHITYTIEGNTDNMEGHKIGLVRFIASCDGAVNITISDVCETSKSYKVKCGLNEIWIGHTIEACDAHLDLTACGFVFGEECSSTSCGGEYSCFKQCHTCRISQHGEGANISVQCIKDPAKLFCKYIDLLRYAIYYQIAVQLAKEIQVSDQCSLLVTNGKGDADRILLWTLGGIDPRTGNHVKGEYPNELKKICKIALDAECSKFKKTGLSIGHLKP